MSTARRVDHTRTSRLVLTGLWADAMLVMAASAWNGGLAFEALGQHIGEGIALGLAVDVGLAVALIGDRALHLAGRVSWWGRALRVSTAAMSLALNCGVALWQGHLGVALFHAFLPVLPVLLSEYAQDTTLQFGEIATEHATAVKAEQDAQLKADRERWEAEQATRTPPPTTPVLASPSVPIRPPVAPAFQAVPRRPGFTPAVGSETSGRDERQPSRAAVPARPADRPVGPPEHRPCPRSETTPRTKAKRPAGSRTDEQLAQTVREMAAQNDGWPPSAYQVKTALRVGHARASRVLDQLATTPTAPAGNGAATGKEHTE